MPMANDDDNSNNKNSLVIKPTELKRKMDKGDDIFILDVRSRYEHDLWTISYDNYPDSPGIKKQQNPKFASQSQPKTPGLESF